MDELIKALREQCEDCSEIGVNAKGCSPMFYCPILDAADALEELQAENAMLKKMQPVNLSGEAAKSFGLALELSKTKAQLAQVTADLEKAKQPEKPEEQDLFSGIPYSRKLEITISVLNEILDKRAEERDAAVLDCSGRCDTCAFEKDCAKHDRNDSGAGYSYFSDCGDWQWRGTREEEQNG